MSSTRANLLSACSSFYVYAVRTRATEADPFEAVLRPVVDPDESPTEGLTEDETAKLITIATAWSPRAEALVKLLYLMGPRVDEILALDAASSATTEATAPSPCGSRAAPSWPSRRRRHQRWT
ncbi:hypothetical protein [Streptomyces sp. NPDC088246]|uniref:hypothetical protein n=1 Tax=Streptomyces sp. NPDC088246 TaxID=3365842 RepID=UPI0037F733CD